MKATKRLEKFLSSDEYSMHRLVLGYFIAFTIYNVYRRGEFGWKNVFVYSFLSWIIYCIAFVLGNVYSISKGKLK